MFLFWGKDDKTRRVNFNKILPPNSTFGLIASEVFYNKSLFKHIRDTKYFVEELKDFPSYEEIKQKYPDKMVPKNGIHFITVKSDHGQVIKDSIMSNEERRKGNFIGNEYAITELEQICPIYGLQLKRNEFFVLWRDLNFKGENIYSDYLKARELYANKIAKMNIYIENSTEEALKFIHKRRYNKIILITSVGLDLSGKKFIEVARKILGANIIVLIFSRNKNHLNWIQKFPNVLYTSDGLDYQDYIKHYNEQKLKELKKRVEEKYEIKLLNFTNDFLSYPNYINGELYSNIDCSEKSSYIRHVKIINNIDKSFLTMNKDGSFSMIKNKEIKESNAWDITLVDNELTLFSNGFYLGLKDNSNKIISDIYMKRWDYEERGESYIIKAKKRNNLLLSVDNGVLCLSDISKNTTFSFIDIY